MSPRDETETKILFSFLIRRICNKIKLTVKHCHSSIRNASVFNRSMDNFIHPFRRFANRFEKFIHPFEQIAHPFKNFIHLFEQIANLFKSFIHPFEWVANPFVYFIHLFERFVDPSLTVHFSHLNGFLLVSVLPFMVTNIFMSIYLL